MTMVCVFRCCAQQNQLTDGKAVVCMTLVPCPVSLTHNAPREPRHCLPYTLSLYVHNTVVTLSASMAKKTLLPVSPAIYNALDDNV